MPGNTDEGIDLAYGLEEKPPLSKSFLLALQHVSVMIVPSTAVAFIVAGAAGLSSADTTFLVQMVILFAGVATVVQAYAVGPVGAKLPIVMGTSFAFVGAMSSIGASSGLDVVFGSIVAAAVVVPFLLGWQFKRLQSFFPPLVTGLIVIIIGLYLVPVGIQYAAGGVGAEDFGSMQNLGLAGLVLTISVLFNLLLKGVWRMLSVIIGISAGYVVAIMFGVVDFTPFYEAAWIAVPTPGRFGFSFELVPLLTFAFLFLVSGMETIGDMSGITAAEGRNPTTEEFRGGIFADGFISALGAVFGSFPQTSFSQNVGIINFTGVMSRHIVGIGGGILIVLGLVPKIGAIVTTIPSAVFGGAVLIMVGMVAASGMRLLFLNIEMNRRNMVIIATALGLGLGVATVPNALSGLPSGTQTFFGEPVIVTGLVALALNTFVPGESSPLFDRADTVPPISEPVDDD
ncbi:MULTISPECIES: uracil-xanthine permease family protein [unclassified Halorubrum]|uniref:uracil-xanthine permease family protein n=1 Tax=unclassified Halorubrum TaxID=2642239 RepID=UPI000B98501D|nr:MULTISPECIES: nucleobase:cation symporter-2 family protein [unclassified Halorubrum]OYR44776.1 uracil permease [Halorubrum sp. Ea8]OYR55843.1 uracil permease [Halorubrum sp. Ea1]